MVFQKAVKKGIRLRLGLCGPTGSGKTWWALSIGKILASDYHTALAVVDSERGSAKKYADKFPFDVLELVSFEPERYIDAIDEAEKSGYGVLVIDSLSHAWVGQGGVLDRVDAITKKQSKPNSYTAWREGSKLQNDLVETMLAFPGQLIVTLRTKMEYEQTKDENGKTRINKIGLQPVQRDGLEYEFDIVCDINLEHELVVSKTRCAEIVDKVYRKHEADKFCAAVIGWLGDQSTVPEAPKEPQADPKTALLTRIKAGEPKVYPVKKAWDAARVKYCGRIELEECEMDVLTEYFKHITEKYKAAKEGAAA